MNKLNMYAQRDAIGLIRGQTQGEHRLVAQVLDVSTRTQLQYMLASAVGIAAAILDELSRTTGEPLDAIFDGLLDGTR